MKPCPFIHVYGCVTCHLTAGFFASTDSFLLARLAYYPLFLILFEKADKIQSFTFLDSHSSRTRSLDKHAYSYETLSYVGIMIYDPIIPLKFLTTNQKK
jgi:hypothetical protein